jgi:hypothetical protein
LVARNVLLVKNMIHHRSLVLHVLLGDLEMNRVFVLRALRDFNKIYKKKLVVMLVLKIII